MRVDVIANADHDAMHCVSWHIQDPSPKQSTMQATFRYDVIRTDRIKYLSHFSSGYKETQFWASAFKQYAKAATPFNADLSRVRVNYTKDDFGRYHPNSEDYNGLSLQVMNKSVRNFLVGEKAQDIDIVNSSPAVLLELIRKHDLGTECGALTNFVESHDECKQAMREAGLKNTKSIKNWMLFGAGECKPSMPAFMGAIRAELKALLPRMRMHYQTIYNKAVVADEEKREEYEKEHPRRRRMENGESVSDYESNVCGLFYNYLYQIHEGKLLRAMDTAGRDGGLWGNDVSWIHDGMVVYPTRPLGEVEFNMLSTAMKAKTGLKVRLISKPMKPALDIDVTKFPEQIVLDPNGGHLAAARIAVMAIGGSYVRDKTSEYLMQDGIWLRGEKAITTGLMARIQGLNIWRSVYNEKTEEYTEKPFTESSVETGRIITSFRALVSHATTEDFAKDVVLGGINKLAFRDGYYEFLPTPLNGKHGRFVEGGVFNTFCRVERMFPVRVQADIDFVYENIINPIFTNTEEGLKETFLAAASRAISGNMDKITYIIHGPRNSGKSALFQFMDNAFGLYVRAVPTRVFACGDGAGSESFRETSWMAEAETARIIKMSELPPSRDARKKVKMDGSKIKAFQSMKEGIMARALYSCQRPYYSLGTGFFLMNDIPEFLPLDSMDRCQLFEFPNEFVTQREKQEDWANANKLLARPEIEQFIQEDRCVNAMIHILLESYRPDPIQPLPSMIQCKEEAMVGQGDELYLNVIEVTMDANDKIVFTELKKELDKFGITDNTIAMGRAIKRIIEDEFKRHEREVPTASQIRRQDQRRQSPTFKKQFYHFIRLRPMYDGTNNGMRVNRINNGDSEGWENENGAYANGFHP